MPHLYTDIETIPAQHPDVLAEIRADKQAALDAAIAAIAPPGNYKKQESIDEWMATTAVKIKGDLVAAFDSEVDEAYRKTGLDGAFGQVCVVGLAVDDSDPVALCELDWQHPDAEGKVLAATSDALSDLILPREILSTCVVGHNVAAFDLRFLAQRSIVRGRAPHHVIGRAAQAKPWESEKVYDTMVQWAGVGRTISLDKLCKALGVQGKKGMTGADVWPAVQAGRIADVASYCLDDVAAVRAVHRRMTFADLQKAA